MEIGDHGLIIQHVQQHVEAEHRLKPEYVTIQHQQMVDFLVLDLLLKTRLVTPISVQVKSSFT